MLTCSTIDSDGNIGLSVYIATNADVFSEIFIACRGAVSFRTYCQAPAQYYDTMRFVVDWFQTS